MSNDFDGNSAASVVLNGELIVQNTNEPTLRVTGQRTAFKTADSDDDAAARHVSQLLSQLGRIVRQRLNLIARQGGAERRATSISSSLGGLVRRSLTPQGAK